MLCCCFLVLPPPRLKSNLKSLEAWAFGFNEKKWIKSKRQILVKSLLLARPFFFLNISILLISQEFFFISSHGRISQKAVELFSIWASLTVMGAGLSVIRFFKAPLVTL